MRKSKRHKRKPGRNDLCPCGSGKKHKHCHGKADAVDNKEQQIFSEENLGSPFLSERLKALQIQREIQEGLGRPIISELIDGVRYILVGETVMHSKSWNTFHDFLFDYIKKALGQEWGNAELKKKFPERHPILQWYFEVCKVQQQFFAPGRISSAPMTGVVRAYLELAYSLYLLAHNVYVQERLIERIKNKDQFLGAQYEVFVAATLIKAGFDLEFEDEDDTSISHCEFTATYRETGAKFSVEAKARKEYKTHSNLQRQLRAALRKRADYTRIIFIDLNLPDKASPQKVSAVFEEALESLRKEEKTFLIDHKPAPPAYIFVTNRPYQYYLEKADVGVSVVGEGFKIPDFKSDGVFLNIREYLGSNKNHYEMYQLMESLRVCSDIPSTFDGEIPEFIFGDVLTRLIIGKRYIIPMGENEVQGTLVDACVFRSNSARVSEQLGHPVGVIRPA